MFFFDSHCHLDDNVFSEDFDKVLDRALNSNVLGMILVGVDEATSYKAINLAQKYKGMYASVGYHPHNANNCFDDSLKRLKKITEDSKVVAWGEIGLDFNRMYSEREKQENCFIRQIEIADDLNLPIIIHERDSEGRLIELLNAHLSFSRVAVIHCFSGTYYEMEQYLKMGFYIGITGIISILERGKSLRNLVKHIPNDRLLIETDSPYLTPSPQRNRIKRNEPAFIRNILLKLAEVKQEDPKILAKQIWENTFKFFRLN